MRLPRKEQMRVTDQHSYLGWHTGTDNLLVIDPDKSQGQADELQPISLQDYEQLMAVTHFLVEQAAQYELFSILLLIDPQQRSFLPRLIRAYNVLKPSDTPTFNALQFEEDLDPTTVATDFPDLRSDTHDSFACLRIRKIRAVA